MQTDAPTTGLREAIAEARDLARQVRKLTRAENIHARGIAKFGQNDTPTSRDDVDMIHADLYALWPAKRLDALLNALETQGAHEGVIEALREAFAPFVDIGAQKGAWGAISKKLDGMAPLTVTVTKAQMLAAITAIRALSSGKTVSAGEGEG
jgi:hypothetical protein